MSSEDTPVLNKGDEEFDTPVLNKGDREVRVGRITSHGRSLLPDWLFWGHILV